VTKEHGEDIVVVCFFVVVARDIEKGIVKAKYNIDHQE
jgi:hypothetical protein